MQPLSVWPIAAITCNGNNGREVLFGGFILMLRQNRCGSNRICKSKYQVRDKNENCIKTVQALQVWSENKTSESSDFLRLRRERCCEMIPI